MIINNDNVFHDNKNTIPCISNISIITIALLLITFVEIYIYRNLLYITQEWNIYKLRP